MKYLLALSLVGCGSVHNVCRAPDPSLCVSPMMAACLNTDAGLVTCERQSDAACGLIAGESADVWASVEAAEEIQGFPVRGH